MVSNCTVPRGVGSITASGKKLQERMLTVCQQCPLWFFENELLYSSHGNKSFLARIVRTVFCMHTRTVTWLHVPQEKTYVPIVVKAPCSGVAGTISKTKLKSGGHGFKLHGLPFASGVISAEWSASLTLHLRLGVGLIDRWYRISHSVEGLKLVPLPCERPFPFPLICANIAAGCLCCFFRAEVPFKSFGWIMYNVERDMHACHAARGLSILTPMSRSKNMRHSKSQALLASGWSRLDGKFSWRQSTWTTLRVLAVHNKMPNGDSMFALWRRLAMSLTLSIGLLTSSSAIWAL